MSEEKKDDTKLSIESIKNKYANDVEFIDEIGRIPDFFAKEQLVEYNSLGSPYASYLDIGEVLQVQNSSNFYNKNLQEKITEKNMLVFPCVSLADHSQEKAYLEESDKQAKKYQFDVVYEVLTKLCGQKEVNIEQILKEKLPKASPDILDKEVVFKELMGKLVDQLKNIKKDTPIKILLPFRSGSHYITTFIEIDYNKKNFISKTMDSLGDEGVPDEVAGFIVNSGKYPETKNQGSYTNNCGVWCLKNIESMILNDLPFQGDAEIDNTPENREDNKFWQNNAKFRGKHFFNYLDGHKDYKFYKANQYRDAVGKPLLAHIVEQKGFDKNDVISLVEKRGIKLCTQYRNNKNQIKTPFDVLVKSTDKDILKLLAENIFLEENYSVLNVKDLITKLVAQNHFDILESFVKKAYDTNNNLKRVIHNLIGENYQPLLVQSYGRTNKGLFNLCLDIVTKESAKLDMGSKNAVLLTEPGSVEFKKDFSDIVGSLVVINDKVGRLDPKKCQEKLISIGVSKEHVEDGIIVVNTGGKLIYKQKISLIYYLIKEIGDNLLDGDLNNIIEKDPGGVFYKNVTGLKDVGVEGFEYQIPRHQTLFEYLIESNKKDILGKVIDKLLVMKDERLKIDELIKFAESKGKQEIKGFLENKYKQENLEGVDSNLISNTGDSEGSPAGASKDKSQLATPPVKKDEPHTAPGLGDLGTSKNEVLDVVSDDSEEQEEVVTEIELGDDRSIKFVAEDGGGNSVVAKLVENLNKVPFSKRKKIIEEMVELKLLPSEDVVKDIANEDISADELEELDEALFRQKGNSLDAILSELDDLPEGLSSEGFADLLFDEVKKKAELKSKEEEKESSKASFKSKPKPSTIKKSGARGLPKKGAFDSKSAIIGVNKKGGGVDNKKGSSKKDNAADKDKPKPNSLPRTETKTVTKDVSASLGDVVKYAFVGTVLGVAIGAGIAAAIGVASFLVPILAGGGGGLVLFSAGKMVAGSTKTETVEVEVSPEVDPSDNAKGQEKSAGKQVEGEQQQNAESNNRAQKSTVTQKAKPKPGLYKNQKQQPSQQTPPR